MVGADDVLLELSACRGVITRQQVLHLNHHPADAIREMSKYSSTDSDSVAGHEHLDAELQKHMKLFRAQRNFFISGFALYLFL